MALKRIPDDVLQEIFSYFTQKELSVVGSTCRYLHMIRKGCRHLSVYIVCNPVLARYSQIQTSLSHIVINAIKDVQHHFTWLPDYVYIGNFCTLSSHSNYSELTTPCVPVQYTTKTLFIENATITIDWVMFPLLEELYIKTSQLDLNIDTLHKCRKLKKVIILINGGVVILRNPFLFRLPDLEIVAISGVLNAAGPTNVIIGPKVRLYRFPVIPDALTNQCYVCLQQPIPSISRERDYHQLFNHHHRIPDEIRVSI